MNPHSPSLVKKHSTALLVLAATFAGVAFSILAAVAVHMHATLPLQWHGELDLAVSGRGYLQITDPETNETRYVRSGQFEINSSGQIVLKHRGQLCLLEPPILLPDAYTRIRVARDGIVYCEQELGAPESPMGQIHLATITGIDDPRLSSFQSEVTAPDRTPMTATPGQNCAGHILSAGRRYSSLSPSFFEFTR